MKWREDLEEKKDPKTGRTTIGTRTTDVGTPLYQVSGGIDGGETYANVPLLSMISKLYFCLLLALIFQSPRKCIGCESSHATPFTIQRPTTCGK